MRFGSPPDVHGVVAVIVIVVVAVTLAGDPSHSCTIFRVESRQSF